MEQPTEIASAPAKPVDPRLPIIASIGDVTTMEDLERLLASGKIPIAYNGFEPSGRLTFAQCMTAVVNVNKLARCGCHFKFWVADWFAKLNGKLGGDLKKIRKAGELMIEVWKVAGLKMERVEFVWASEGIMREPMKYWETFLDITTHFTIQRALKGTPALGREESMDLPLSALVYAAMQVCDIMYLGVDICQMGKDQLKVNMLAREYCQKIGRKFPPVIISHEMLGGLDGGDKMSKSSPDTALFMDDDPAEVNRKIKRAFCPEWRCEGPVFSILNKIIFEMGSFTVQKRDGDAKIYEKYADLVADVEAKALHPAEIKPALAARINEILAPVQRHFVEDKAAAQLLKTVRGYKITK